MKGEQKAIRHRVIHHCCKRYSCRIHWPEKEPYILYIYCCAEERNSTTQNEKYWASIKDRREREKRKMGENTLHLRRVLHSFSIIVFVIEKFFIWFIIKHWMVWAMIGEWPRSLESVCVSASNIIRKHFQTNIAISSMKWAIAEQMYRVEKLPIEMHFIQKNGIESNRIKLNQTKPKQCKQNKEMSELYVLSPTNVIKQLIYWA